MRPTFASSALPVFLLIWASACGTVQTAMTPAAPLTREMPGIGEVPDGINHVRLTVDSVGKGKLGWAKSPDLGLLPALYAPPDPFDHLARNEIVIQYPAITSIRSDSATTPPPVVGEQAVFLFRRCWNCITLALATGVGPYKANPLVAAGWASKLDPAEWPRVAALLTRIKRSRK
jgi:hypothetical protein